MNWAVIMAGGRGTRFWPESRATHPKPFLRLLGERTLLEETAGRLKPLFSHPQILMVLQAELVGRARRLLPGIPRRNFLGEPVGRNTAPCCVYAASQIERRDPDAKIVFLPADQHIQPQSLFQKTLKAAFQVVDERPVLIGLRPTSPHPGFGYLEVERRAGKVRGISLFRVRRFHEKPSLEKARNFLRQGNFLWNGGTFVWTLDAFKSAVKRYLPAVYRVWNRLGSGDVGAYRALPSLSLDYAVMEKMKDVHCLLAPYEWSDVGGWEGLAEFLPEDSKENRVHGNVLLVKCRRNIVRANERRLVALLGVEDLVVVDTKDALLIVPRNRTEDIRGVVRELEKRKASQYL